MNAGEAARAAVDELMTVAAALVNFGDDGSFDPDAKEQVQLVLTKARTAKAALEHALAEPQPANSANSVTGPEQHAASKAEGAPMTSFTPSPKERGGPKDADQAPAFFHAELKDGTGASQVHSTTGKPHCAKCGIRLDVKLPDPCRIGDCPIPARRDPGKAMDIR